MPAELSGVDRHTVAGLRTDDGDPWLADTLAMCLSTTKGVVSAALYLQADAGRVDYDAPVATYWPEFAQNRQRGPDRPSRAQPLGRGLYELNKSMNRDNDGIACEKR